MTAEEVRKRNDVTRKVETYLYEARDKIPRLRDRHFRRSSRTGRLHCGIGVAFLHGGASLLWVLRATLTLFRMIDAVEDASSTDCDGCGSSGGALTAPKVVTSRIARVTFSSANGYGPHVRSRSSSHGLRETSGDMSLRVDEFAVIDAFCKVKMRGNGAESGLLGAGGGYVQ